MSIQMAKQGGFISIKNRYNHTVQNPDNIIYGLSASLMQYFNIKFHINNNIMPNGYTFVGDRKMVHLGARLLVYNTQYRRVASDGKKQRLRQAIVNVGKMVGRNSMSVVPRNTNGGMEY